MNDDFYIGWEDKAPPSYGRPTGRIVLATLGLVLLAALSFSVSQRLIDTAFFDWGHEEEFTGRFRADPYPHLILTEDATNSPATITVVPLVATFKFGLSRKDVASFDGKPVQLRATRIHRDGMMMLEVADRSIRSISENISKTLVPATKTQTMVLGKQTFLGEIVDSKCWMGVMNPGVLKPHRACAVRCISGGIPPMLLVRRENAAPLNLLLVSQDGKSVNDQVLDLVAEPVEITGVVERQGDLLILRADPATYRKL